MLTQNNKGIFCVRFLCVIDDLCNRTLDILISGITECIAHVFDINNTTCHFYASSDSPIIVKMRKSIFVIKHIQIVINIYQ